MSAVVGDSPSSESLIDYLERFWDYERSEYVRHKKAYKHRISKKHCHTMANHVGRWWKPFFQDLLLGEVTGSVLNEFALSLSGKLAESSINHVLRAGITALRWAKKKGYVATDPTADVDPFPENPKKRDVLTSDEVRKLFSLEWPDEIAELASLVAMTTGARAGEIAALRVQDIEEDRLQIRHSWSEHDGMGPPKSGDPRTVPLLPEIRDQLRRLARFNPHKTGDDSFVFWSSLRPDRPRDSKAFSQGLSDALVLLSESAATLTAGKRGERARRNGKAPKPEDVTATDTVIALRKAWRDRGVSFHSWRHYFATRMADRVDMRTLQLATGHKTEAMAEHYSNHADPAYFTAVAQAGVDAFSGVVEGLKSSA